MISIYSISLAYLIGIYWGIYAKMNSLYMSLIFLLLFVFLFSNVIENKIINKIKNNKNFSKKRLIKVSMLLSLFCIIGAFRAELEIKKFDYKYSESDNFNSIVTILTHREESKYYYKYICSMENNERLILMFKKNYCDDFKIGDIISISRQIFFA